MSTDFEQIHYQTKLINQRIGELRLTNEAVAQRVTEARRRTVALARPMAYKTVAAIRDGDPNIRLTTLKEVLDALGLTLAEVFTPTEERTETAA